MLLVALVFGELASHYPVAGALYQYSKFSVGPAYGWFVGWFYGIALLITVAAVDTGVVTYVTASPTTGSAGASTRPTTHDPGRSPPACCDPDDAEHHRRQGDGRGSPSSACTSRSSARSASRDPGDPRLPPRPRVPVLHPERPARGQQPARAGLRRPLADRRGAVAVLAPVYIFYGFESAGDISEETKDAGVRCRGRCARRWSGAASPRSS